MICNHKITRQIITLGTIAGMRATFAPAIVSHYLGGKPIAALANSKLNFIRLPLTGMLTKLFAAIEIIGDKVPSAPNRTSFTGVFGRVASGVFVGAVICQANKQNLQKGILIGGTSALAATFISFYARKYIGNLTHADDVIIGCAEDIIALGSAITIMQ